MQFLIDNGSPVDYVSKDGWTALKYLVEFEENADILEMFMRRAKPNVNLRPETGDRRTALMVAAKAGAVEKVLMLLEHPKINVNRRVPKGPNALETAAMAPRAKIQIIAALVNKGCMFNPACCRERSIDPSVMEYLRYYPQHLLNALMRQLGQELSILVTNPNNLPKAIRKKIDLEYRNDLNLAHLFYLPYHRLQDGIAHFERRCDWSSFFKCSVDLSDFTPMCKALALAAHNTSAAREMAERHAKESEFKKHKS
jgi:ankyrin repeat protein